MKIYIYALCNPGSDIPKYIGRTKDINKRLSSHIQDVKKHNNKKTVWLKELLDNYLVPDIIILDVVKISDSEFWEQHYISLYKSWNIELLNSTNGGERVTENTGKNIIKKNRKHSEETKKKISKRLLERNRLFNDSEKSVLRKRKLITAVQGKQIECTHTDGRVLIFNSMMEACRNLELKDKKVQDYVKGRRYGKYKGWLFKYL